MAKHLLKILVAAVLLSASSAGSSQDHPFPAKFVEVEGGQIAYREGGDRNGEPILFVHGSTMADSFLRLLSEPELANYRLISYHRRGYGESSDFDGPITRELQVQDALALLKDLGIDRVHLVGHSQGGHVVQPLASAEPDLVQSIMLLEAGGPPLVDAPSRAEWAQIIFGEGGANWSPPQNDASVEEAPTSTADQVAAWLEDFGGSDWRTDLVPHFPGVVEQMTNDWAFARGKDREWLTPTVNEEFYLRITHPTIQVVSEYQRNFLLFFPQQTWYNLPHAYIGFLPEMSHTMMIMHPEPVAELIADWVSKHPIED
jgi:pimeloyl-ACP methyl ester carboxylesterase